MLGALVTKKRRFTANINLVTALWYTWGTGYHILSSPFSNAEDNIASVLSAHLPSYFHLPLYAREECKNREKVELVGFYLS